MFKTKTYGVNEAGSAVSSELPPFKSDLHSMGRGVRQFFCCLFMFLPVFWLFQFGDVEVSFLNCLFMLIATVVVAVNGTRLMNYANNEKDGRGDAHVEILMFLVLILGMVLVALFIKERVELYLHEFVTAAQDSMPLLAGFIIFTMILLFVMAVVWSVFMTLAQCGSVNKWVTLSVISVIAVPALFFVNQNMINLFNAYMTTKISLSTEKVNDVALVASALWGAAIMLLLWVGTKACLNHNSLEDIDGQLGSYRIIANTKNGYSPEFTVKLNNGESWRTRGFEYIETPYDGLIIMGLMALVLALQCAAIGVGYYDFSAFLGLVISLLMQLLMSVNTLHSKKVICDHVSKLQNQRSDKAIRGSVAQAGQDANDSVIHPFIVR